MEGVEIVDAYTSLISCFVFVLLHSCGPCFILNYVLVHLYINHRSVVLTLRHTTKCVAVRNLWITEWATLTDIPYVEPKFGFEKTRNLPISRLRGALNQTRPNHERGVDPRATLSYSGLFSIFSRNDCSKTLKGTT